MYPSLLQRKLCLQMYNIACIFAQHDREINLIIIKHTGTTTVAEFVERRLEYGRQGSIPDRNKPKLFKQVVIVSLLTARQQW